MPEPDREAYEAAERLVREAQVRAEEAAQAAAEGGAANGWSSGATSGGPPFPDLTALLGLVDAARGAIPPELARQLTDAVRELLIAIRAVLDYSIDRLEPGEPESVQVEDIPIS
jgi:hypothetical protein